VFQDFKRGRYALASGLLPADIDRLRSDPKLSGGYHQSPGLATAYLQFNCRSGPLADPALRRTLFNHLDRDRLTRVFPKLDVPASALIPPDLLGRSQAPRSARPQDGKARESLSGLRLTAAVFPAKNAAFERVTDAIREQLRPLGADITVINETVYDYMELIERGATDLIVGRWMAEYPDADAYVNGLFHSRTGVTHHYFSSERIDALIAAAREESDPDSRRAIYRKFEQIIARETVLLPLSWEQHYRFVQPDVEGFELGMAAPLVPYELLRRQ